MILTKFIRAHTPEELTQMVQSAEHDGWTYVGLGIGGESCLVAVLQRVASQTEVQT